jgi:hypothetical protein
MNSRGCTALTLCMLALFFSLTVSFGQTIPLVRVVDAKTNKPLAGVEVGCITRGGDIKVVVLHADSLGRIDLARHPKGTIYDFSYSGYHSKHLTIEEIHAASYVVKLEPRRKSILRWLCG